MKQLLILFVLLTITTLTNAQDSDYALVEKTLGYYLDGGTNNDFETLKKAFHKTATMKYIADEYKEVNAIDFFKEVMTPGPKSTRKTRIDYINITGHAANAKLEIDYKGFTYFDYMNLLKINGEWKIVSKIFYKKELDAIKK